MTSPQGTRSLQLLAFGALAAFAAAEWVTLVSDPPFAGAAAVAVATCVTGAALTLLAGDLGRVWPWIVAALVVVAAFGAGVLGLGLDPALLAPGGWDQLADGIGQGIQGLADADYPYSGQNPWVRRAILLALPLVLSLAAVLAFWPGRRRHPGGALVLLLAFFGLAVTVNPPAAPVLWGLVLFVLLAAWYWLPSVELRTLPATAAALAVAAAVGFGAGVALDGDDPWIDWTSWRWPGEEPHVDFRWNHTYGPIDWPREGTALLRAESEEPHYWRTISLDHFDGYRWEVETERSNIYEPLELPSEVEDTIGADPDPEWVEEVTFTVGALDTGLLVAPGRVLEVEGVDGVVPGSGATFLTAEPLREGDEYTVTSYAPEPSAARLRDAPEGYAEALRNYTRLELPRRLANGTDAAGDAVYTTRNITVPPWGEPTPPAIEQRLDESAYARVHDLAERLVAGQPTTYDAVAAVERHLRDNYSYSESPPERPLPLDAFLFRDRLGYCQQFSGAMTLMLRTLGIPSRVASGFSSGEREDGGGAFQVSDRDAHSWVEVYFNGIGWVSFEPTPSAAPAGPQLTALASARQTTELGQPGVIPRRGLVIPTVAGNVGADLEDEGSGPWGAVLTGLLVLLSLTAIACLALAAAVVFRGMRFRGLPAEEAARAQALELERALPRMGFPIPEGATLLQLEHRLSSRRALSRYLARLRGSRYGRGGSPPDASDRRAVRGELADGRGLAGRLRALLAMPPGAPR